MRCVKFFVGMLIFLMAGAACAQSDDVSAGRGQVLHYTVRVLDQRGQLRRFEFSHDGTQRFKSEDLDAGDAIVSVGLADGRFQHDAGAVWSSVIVWRQSGPWASPRTLGRESRRVEVGGAVVANVAGYQVEVQVDGPTSSQSQALASR